MGNEHIKGELPPNYEELKKAANRTANWRERLKAVEELGQWENQQTIDILQRVAAEDAVYKVQEAAYRKLKKIGADTPSPSRKKGDLIKGVTKILLRIKKSLPEGHTVEEFKEKLQRTRIDVYDTYEGEKGADFDQWLENTWASLSTKDLNHKSKQK
ncbi:HEAT repeat domain-containing protein [Paenibacillus harenae]|uniref:HEAT repeat domain-containing protein n=1 Tax=Paenibacillus harenae TaxID=306543 RepID=UPI00048A4A77|nr:HEAT repeat domain-containing protein [Paenibacillus harenae]